MRVTHWFSIGLVTALFPLLVLAAEPVAEIVVDGAGIAWHPAADHAAMVLSVQRPDGEVSTETFASGRTPRIRVADLGGDGTYAWELRAVPRIAPRLQAGRDRVLVQTGSFTVMNGAIVPAGAPERTGWRGEPATNTFFTDDVSAKGGVCAGFDCTSSETYGFDSLKLKENTLRLKFDDTSTLAGFSAHDWQLGTGDGFSGGVEKFFVENVTAATIPLLIEGTTPSNALYLDSTGRIGFRTSTPAKDLHVNTSSTPTIRLEQNTSGGLGARSWDITANDSNFFLRDVTAATNPIIVRSAAPSVAFVIDAAGRIGFGVGAPLYQIHHVSGARLDGGNWTNASSRETKQDIRRLDSADAMDALRALQPVTYAYKTNPADTQVGFIAEEVPAIVATPDRKGLSPMDVVAVLTRVVQEQQKTIEEMRGRLERLEERH